jgi:hypothetical protein
MTKRPPNKRNRLSDDIDSRLVPYIQQIQQENKDGSVTAHTIFQYVQNVDFSFKRMKKAQLERSIDRGKI